MTRALVTGAAGFVGRHLAAELSASGVSVVAVDREDGDLRDAAAALALVTAAAPDVVFHLAGQSSAARSLDDPVGTFEANVVGTVSVLEAVRRGAPAARVVVASSADAYGESRGDDVPVAETHSLAPMNPYAASKASQEVVALQYARSFGLEVVVTRSFNSVGPGQSAAFALPSFAAQLACIARGEGEPVLRVGNLDVWRDFTDVRDVARAYVLLAGRGASAGVYNICSGEAVSLRSALEWLIAASGVGVRVEVDPDRLRPADTARMVGDNTRLRLATGWAPAIPLARSLSDLYEHERAAL